MHCLYCICIMYMYSLSMHNAFHHSSFITCMCRWRLEINYNFVSSQLKKKAWTYFACIVNYDLSDRIADRFWQGRTIFGGQIWSGRTNFGGQIWSGRTNFGDQKWSAGPLLGRTAFAMTDPMSKQQLRYKLSSTSNKLVRLKS